jgi:methyl-accepting chemotaxis protein
MSIKIKIILIIAIFSIFILTVFFFIFTNYVKSLVYENLKSNMTKALEFAKLIPEYTDINVIKDLAQNNFEKYMEIVKETDKIVKIFNLIYLYIMEPTEEGIKFLMSNEYVEELFKEDYLSIYDYPPEELIKAIEKKEPLFTQKPYKDEYGTFISYFYPLINDEGKVYAVIGIDYEISFVNKILNNIYRISLFIMFFILISIIFLTIFLEINIIKPINEISGHMLLISEGKLFKIKNKKLNEISNNKTKSKNELLNLINSINKMVENTSNSIVELMKISEKLYDITAKNNNLINNFLESINSQASSLEEISAAIEEATNSIRLISQNASESSQKILDGSKKALDADKYIDTIINSITKISDYSKKIRKSIDLIYEITDETHILALNASIEASKAGEIGIGFAVVAQEIRNLAEKAENTVSEIEKVIKENDKIVNESLISIKNSREKLKSILELNISSTNIINEIKDSIKEQADVTEELTKAIDDINLNTQKFLDASDILGKIANEIVESANDIKENIKYFTLYKD